MASLSLSLSPLLSQSLRVSPGAAGQARLGERLVAVGDGGVDRAGGWTRTSRDRYVRACRPRSTSRHMPGSSRQPHLRAAGSNNHMRERPSTWARSCSPSRIGGCRRPPTPAELCPDRAVERWDGVARGGAAADALSLQIAPRWASCAGWRRRSCAWACAARFRSTISCAAAAAACASRNGEATRYTTIQLFLTATRPAAISSASTSSSTMCTRLPADRTHAHRGAWGHTRADHLSPPPAEAARPPPSAMSQPDGQRREPLVLEEEHELDRDHREQLASRDRRLCARGCSCAPAAARAVGCCCDISRHTR